MEPTRLILVPQLPVAMRYTEWWPREAVRNFSQHFAEIHTLGGSAISGPPHPAPTDAKDFSACDAAMRLEAEQIKEYLDLPAFKGRTSLLHFDLSYPGLFHGVLGLKPVDNAVVFCHATSLNRHDTFKPMRDWKSKIEHGHAHFYESVVVASAYHARKLRNGWRLMGPDDTVVTNLKGLPYPPGSLGHEEGDQEGFRTITYGSTARPTFQKVNAHVEAAFEDLVKEPIHRTTHKSWSDYFGWLRQTRYLIVTSREETFGYQIMDALLSGCIPIAPDRYSYRELLPPRYLYDPTGTPKTVAKRILDVVERLEKLGRMVPRLMCQDACLNFWDNLREEIDWV